MLNKIPSATAPIMHAQTNTPAMTSGSTTSGARSRSSSGTSAFSGALPLSPVSLVSSKRLSLEGFTGAQAATVKDSTAQPLSHVLDTRNAFPEEDIDYEYQSYYEDSEDEAPHRVKLGPPPTTSSVGKLPEEDGQGNDAFVVLPQDFPSPAASKPHIVFSKIPAHTAKCDRCEKHNVTELYRCRDCSTQFCEGCKGSIGLGHDGGKVKVVGRFSGVHEKAKGSLQSGVGKQKKAASSRKAKAANTKRAAGKRNVENASKGLPNKKIRTSKATTSPATAASASVSPGVDVERPVLPSISHMDSIWFNRDAPMSPPSSSTRPRFADAHQVLRDSYSTYNPRQAPEHEQHSLEATSIDHHLETIKYLAKHKPLQFQAVLDAIGPYIADNEANTPAPRSSYPSPPQHHYYKHMADAMQYTPSPPWNGHASYTSTPERGPPGHCYSSAFNNGFGDGVPRSSGAVNRISYYPQVYTGGAKVSQEREYLRLRRH
ncbi:hypothetical protein KEM55_002193 [Ascosphaera atra]|nr:hypothetical protein KEM55_002193 [Ascosphaera atra]